MIGKKVLFIFSAQKWYTRNEYIEKLLINSSGKDVDVICSGKKQYFFRVIEVLWRYMRVNKDEYDLIYVGFLAQILVPFVRLFYRGRIVGDYFLSVYDTICGDRQYYAKNSWIGRLIYHFEKWTLELCNHVIVDTEQSRKYLHGIFNFPLHKISVIYVRANEKLFYPRLQKEGGVFTVFFYGSGQPLHGIDVILRAAKIVEYLPLRFELIGPIERSFSGLLDELSLQNVDFIDWVDYQLLPGHIAKADICLGGHFSDNEKAKRVIAGKTFQFAAMKKAIILGENEANKELFDDGVNCLMVALNNPEALGDAIRRLIVDAGLRQKISEQALALMQNLRDDLTFLD